MADKATWEIDSPYGVLEIESDSQPTKEQALAAVRAYGDRMAAQAQSKTAAQAPGLDAPSLESAGRFLTNAADAAIVQPIKGIASAVAHPIDTVSGIAAASLDQVKQAKNAAAMGRYWEAGGHALGALPVIGPAAVQAGEQIASGDIAGGLGRAAGMLAPFGAAEAMRARALNPRAAEIAERTAREQVAGKVLAPGNPSYRGRAAAIAPEMLARKLTGGREELRQAAAEGMADAGQRIDEAIQQAGGTQAGVSLMLPIAKLQQRIHELTDPNGLPLSERAGARVKALKNQITRLRALSTGGAATFEDLRKLRDESYDVANAARGYERAGNLQMADEGWAARETGDAIRETFAQRSPDQAKANADYTFWKTLDDVLDPVIGRPKQSAPSQGVTGGMVTIGAHAGQLIGGKAGAFIGSTVVPWLQKRVASPEWQLADAQSKMRLAKGLKTGDIGLMKSAMVKIDAYGRVTSPSGSQTQTTEPAQ